MKHFMCPSFQFGANLGHRRPAWNLEFFESCRVSQGRLKYAAEQKMLFLVKLNPGFSTSLTIRRGQSNFSIAFIFLSFEEKGYCRVISVGKVGQLSFDCLSYCGRSRRMQGY